MILLEDDLLEALPIGQVRFKVTGQQENDLFPDYRVGLFLSPVWAL